MQPYQPPVQPVQPYQPPLQPYQPPVQPVVPVQPPVPPPAAPPDMLTLPGPVVFQAGRPAIDASCFPVLDAVALFLRQHPELVQVGVYVHTYEKKNARQNLELSLERAREVAAFITAQGVAKARILPKGFGDTQPQADPQNPGAGAKVDRVEFPILQKN